MPKRRRSLFKNLLIFALLAGMLGAAALCVVYGIWASTFDMAAVKEMRSRSTVYDMDGNFYSRLAGENRVVIPLGKVSRHFIQALLAREDSRFYQHHGVDPEGIARAIFRNVFSGSKQGASTITQQLARNSYPDQISGSSKSANRKLLEAFVAARIEQHYSKDEILENYVNRIYFGTVYGVEAASLAYFGRHASDLTLGQAALLAGIIRGPGYYSPFAHLDRAIAARDAVLQRMVKIGQITQHEAEEARAAPLALARKRPLSPEQNYAMDAIQTDVNELLSGDQQIDGGFKIFSTIDPKLQKTAEASLDSELRKIESKPGFNHPRRADYSPGEDESHIPYLQGAVIVIENRTGAIRALVGGRDFGESSFNRAIKAKRQIGSTFKPFVYATAISRGMLPGMFISDGPIARGEIKGAANWSPENSDGTFKGTLHAEEGLIQSRNTMSVRVGQYAGLDNVAKTAAIAGISGMPIQPSAFIGAFDTTLEQLTSAYTIFPNNGQRRQSYVVERIDDASNQVIYRAAHIETGAMDPAVAWMVTTMLQKVLERGTAASSRSLGWTKVGAGKTGTTNDFKDAWFVGYTTSLTCGVWVGLDHPETIMSKGYGAALALPVWVDVMNTASPQQYPAAGFKAPEPIEKVTVCAVSNGLATSGCDAAGTDYSIDLPVSLVPREPCSTHRGGVISEPAPTPGQNSKRSIPESIFRSFKRFFGGD